MNKKVTSLNVKKLLKKIIETRREIKKARQGIRHQKWSQGEEVALNRGTRYIREEEH